MMSNTITTCLRPLHCLRQPYPFPHSSLQESSILHHTQFPLIYSPSHSLTYMESLGCMLFFTPSHTCEKIPKKMPHGSLSLAHADDPPCDARHSSFHLGKNSVRPTFNLLRMSHIRNSVRLTFHLLQIFHIQLLTPDRRGGRFNFPGQTYPDPLIALTWRVSQPFCTVPRFSPEAS